MGRLDTGKINSGSSCLREIGNCLKDNLNAIESDLDFLNRSLGNLSSYNGSDASSKYSRFNLRTQKDEWFKDIWNVIVKGKVSKYDFSLAEGNIKLLLTESDDLSKTAKLIDDYIEEIDSELGKGAANFILFDPMRTREKGLNSNLLKYHISKKNYDELLKLCGNEKELDRLLLACSEYSKSNGCGGYSLLFALNSKKNLNMSKEKFFGDYLMDKLSVRTWYETMKKKADGDGAGPISDIGAKRILKSEGIDAKTLKSYTKDNFTGDDKDELYNHLKKGGKATIMVESIEDKNYNYEDFKKTFYNFDQKNDTALREAYNNRKRSGRDTSLAKTRHYITVTSIDDKGNISYVDSADLNSSNVRHTTYENMVKHVVNKKDSGNLKDFTDVIESKITGTDRKSFHYGTGGCVLF